MVIHKQAGVHVCGGGGGGGVILPLLWSLVEYIPH